MRRLLSIAVLLLSASALHAITVSGTTIQDGNGNGALMSIGQACFSVSPYTSQTCFPISNGSFSGSVATGTYRFQVLDPTGIVLLTLDTVVVPTVGSWTFESYQVPYTSPQAPAASGNGPPYLKGSYDSLNLNGSQYRQLDPQLAVNALWTFGGPSQGNRWFNSASTPTSQNEYGNQYASHNDLTKALSVVCPSPPCSGSNISGQTPATIPVATAANAIGKPSPLSVDDVNTPTKVISSTPIIGPVVTSSVNKIISVIAPPYNAKCDGVTDDQTAIQAAFTDSYSTGATIQFPSGTCLTSTIVWKGQHFFGAGMGRTMINGKPGQDVFQTPDNNSWSMVEAPTVHDLTIGVDASVNAAATAGGGNNTFPKRVGGTVQGLTLFTTVPIAPGQWAIGADGCSGKGFNTTASSTTVSLTLCALAYQFGSMDPALTTNVPITITNGDGVGSDYNGTLVGVLSGCTGGATCQFTVTPAPAATVTNATGKMLNAPTPPWYFGNAGFALQCSDGSNCIANALSMNFTNLKFVEINAGGKLALNHATGIFTQLAPYASHFKSILFFQLYGGYIEVPSYAGRVVTADTSSFKDIDVFQAFIPMMTYNGNDRDLTNINIYAELPGNLGPFFLTAQQLWGQSGANIWTINSIYMEGSAGQLGEVARFQSGYYNVKAANIFAGFQGTTWIEWAASASSWDGQSPGFKIDGNSNTFINTWTLPAGIVDNGFANEVKSTYQPGTPYYQARRSCLGKSCRNPINTMDASFIAAGNNSTPFTGASDMFFLCNDFGLPMNPAGSTTATCVSDSTTTQPWHSYLQSAGPTSVLDFLNNGGYQNIWSGQAGARLFGTHLPQTTGTTYVIGQCVGAATCSATLLVKDGTANSTISTSPTLNFTSTVSTLSFPTNLSSTTFGNSLDYRFQSWVNTGTNYRIYAIWFAPDNTDEHTWLSTNGVPSSGGNKPLANPADTRVCTGPTSVTAGHIFTATGTGGCSLQDGGVPPAALLTNVPSWLQYYGDGNEGALTCPSGTCNIIPGSRYYTTCSVTAGAILAAVTAPLPAGPPLILHCSTSATIAGTISYSLNTGSSTGTNAAANYGGGGGGGGFGAANGVAGGGYISTTGQGTAGTSGVSGGNGTAAPIYVRQTLLDYGFAWNAATQCGGSAGGAGGSSGGAAGRGGGCVIIISPSINFTGTVDVSGVNGGAGGANTGGGGGGSGGVVILRSPSMTNSGTITLTGGTGGPIGSGTSTKGGDGATGWSKVYSQ